MSHSLNDLSTLQDVPLDEGNIASLDDLKETGSYLPMLQPGVYEFETPSDMNIPWDTIEKEGQPTRVQVQFDENHPLKIVAGTDAARVGEPYTTRVSNVPRERTFGGEKVKINDLQYLLKKLGEKVLPKTNREYLLALQKYGGRRFRSAVSVSWSCNPNRDIRMWIPDPADPTGQKGERKEVAGQKGCGTRCYPDGKTNGVPKGPDGKYPEEIICPKCHALLRGFSNLDLVREA